MSGLLMKYFVLKPAGSDIFAAASRKAMRAYAMHVMEDNPIFAQELRDWADREQIAAHKPSPNAEEKVDGSCSE
jgi:hypothetical protein